MFNDAGEFLTGERLSTQFLSTSKSYERALKCYAGEDGSNVSFIDLAKIDDAKIIDVSNGEGLTYNAYHWARQDQEVLIRESIPPEAYIVPDGILS